jgi:hypothetical protein
VCGRSLPLTVAIVANLKGSKAVSEQHPCVLYIRVKGANLGCAAREKRNLSSYILPGWWLTQRALCSYFVIKF